MGGGNSKADLADILVMLAQTDVSPEAHDFWDELWKLNTTAEDVFELISPDDVRQLRRERPENVVTLFTQAVAQLCQIVHTPVPVYFGQATNCLRILTRLLPFLLEDGPGDAFCEQLCWGVDDADAGRAEGGGEESGEAPEPLARLVVHAGLHLLFLPAFTVDATAFEGVDDDAAVPERALWAPGVGGPEASPASSLAFDRNRCEVLRLLLAASCEPLYDASEAFDPWRSRWLACACARDAPNAQLLLCSLLNTVCSYDPVGLGLPYGGSLAAEAPTTVVALSAQVLVALLDYGDAAAEPTDARHNVFRELLGAISGADAFEFLFAGLARLLNNVHEALNTKLPGSLTQVECYQELLVLLWKLLEANPAFSAHVLVECDVTRLVVPVCFLMYQARKDPARVGLVHICTFVLLKLSGERAFCVALNKPFADALPTDLPLFDGTHADLCVVVLHKMVVNGGERLSSLYNCFLTVLCNLSPYAKSLSLVAAVKLVNLFELFTSPKVLYAAEQNHAYVALLLEIFNNVIQYQYGGNPHLVYAVVRRRAVFENLERLDVATARAGARAREAARRERADRAAADANAADVPADAGGVDAPPPPPPGVEGAPPPPRLRPPPPPPSAAAFEPSEDWLARVKAELPLSTIMRLLHHLAPQIDELCGRAEFSLDEVTILDFIKNSTMVGLLPVPHAIVIRKYQPNTFTSLWFTAFMWGVIFLQNQVLPLFDGNAIKLFTVSVV